MILSRKPKMCSFLEYKEVKVVYKRLEILLTFLFDSVLEFLLLGYVVVQVYTDCVCVCVRHSLLTALLTALCLVSIFSSFFLFGYKSVMFSYIYQYIFCVCMHYVCIRIHVCV